jgi:glucan-binding repeat-containing protein
MLKKTITSLLIAGVMFGTVATSASAVEMGWSKNADNSWSYTSYAQGNYASKWLQEGDKYYYFDADGKMATGWRTIDGKRYYFGEDGSRAAGWWYCINGGWYYFDKTTGECLQ